MERVLLDQVIETDYGQFDLVWTHDAGFDGNFDRFFAGQVNGLVGATDRNDLYLNLARRSGGSPVKIVLTDEAPDVDTSWEDIVEVSTSIPPGSRVQWLFWAGESSGALAAIDPGTYRVRVSARGGTPVGVASSQTVWSMPTWCSCGPLPSSRM